MPGGVRRGAGRKPVNIDLVELEKLSALQCTDEELAAWFGVSTRTIEKRRKQPEFGEAMRRGKDPPDPGPTLAELPVAVPG